MASAYRLIPPVVFVSAALGVMAQDTPVLKVEQPIYFKDIGYDDLRLRLGQAIPDGSGVSIMQVEPAVSSDVPIAGKSPPSNYPNIDNVFAPNRKRPEITLGSGANPPKTFSGHSTSVAQLLYGRNSIAPGVAKVTIVDPETEFVPKWLGFPKGKVKVGGDVPVISSHSYVEDQQALTDVVRRLDDFIDKNNHIAVVAVGKNNKNAPIAPLFGSSYNAIVVGLSNGNCANGLTLDNGDGPGRTKPDIVVPAGTTSEATPIVAAACALLVQAAGKLNDKYATHPTVIKACLMAGAEKQFDFIKLAGGWARDKKLEKSLNPVVGAGQLNIDLAHRILTSGSQIPGAEGLRKELNGWAYDLITTKDGYKTYVIDIPDEQQSIGITAALTWNRSFDESQPQPIVPVFELALGRLDSKGEFERVIDISQSKIDNSEIVWSNAKLDPGRYGFRVKNTGGFDSRFALAWTVKTKTAPGIVRPKARVATNTDLKWVYLALSVAVVAILILLWRFRFLFMTIGPAPRR